jgi:hypothetical protein
MTGTVVTWDAAYQNGRIAEDQSGAFLYHFAQRDFESGQATPTLGDRVSFFRGRDKLKIAKRRVYRTAAKVKRLTTGESLEEISEAEVPSNGDSYSLEPPV